jgi:hypothetical protein
VTDVLPDGPAALGHPTNEDLFVGTPVRAAFARLFKLSGREGIRRPSLWSGLRFSDF